MKRQDKDDKDNKVEEVYVPYVLVAVITSPVIGWILVKEKGFDFEGLGTFGDFLGGSTVPLLTFITVLLLIRTVSLQSHQLDVQKQEFKLLTKEMEDTKEVLKEQGKTARMQRFENSFTKQIDELRKVKSIIEKEHNQRKGGNVSVSYKNIMLWIYKRINDETNHEMAFLSVESTDKATPDVFALYWKLYNIAYHNTISRHDKFNADTFDRYYFIIERIVILIYHNKSVMDEWEMEFYIDSFYDEITTSGYNLALFHLAYRSKQKQKVKELELLMEYIFVTVDNNKFISAAFEFLLNGSSDGWAKN